MTGAATTRSEFIRPIVAAICLTAFGELLIFLFWGLWWFPATGPQWAKAGWTATCGIAMGAAVGALVALLVSGRMTGSRAAWAAGAIYFLVLAFCAVLCWRIDMALGYFGGRSAPWLFLLGGWVPAGLTAFLYGWLTFGSGRKLFDRHALEEPTPRGA